MEITPIGVVQTSVTEPVDDNWGEVVSEIRVREELAPGLAGLEEFTHVLVITYLHLADWDPARHLQRRPRDREDMPLRGVFAQRQKHRPNPIGVTAVEVLGVEGGVLRVRGLDAVDGTPVLDLKPYTPAFDSMAQARIPEWLQRLMEGYF